MFVGGAIMLSVGLPEVMDIGLELAHYTEANMLKLLSYSGLAFMAAGGALGIWGTFYDHN